MNKIIFCSVVCLAVFWAPFELIFKRLFRSNSLIGIWIFKYFYE